MDFKNQVPDDAAVIRDVLAGNVNAFEILIDRYQDHVAQIVRNHVPRDKSPEITHDTFVQAYQSLGNFRGTCPFKYWLAKIAVRCCYDYWRGYYKRLGGSDGSFPDDWSGLIAHLLSGQSLQQEKEKLEARDLLQWALGKLSPAERMVLTLTYLNEYSVAESAEILGWSIPKVKIRSHRARKKLQKILTNIFFPNK
jgi:RNA polymerase sigma-70 factor (ECF subfamily)